MPTLQPSLLHSDISRLRRTRAFSFAEELGLTQASTVMRTSSSPASLC